MSDTYYLLSGTDDFEYEHCVIRKRKHYWMVWRDAESSEGFKYPRRMPKDIFMEWMSEAKAGIHKCTITSSNKKAEQFVFLQSI